MRVYLAEKASQARDLANVLDNSNVAEDGYIRVNEDEIVTKIILILNTFYS